MRVARLAVLSAYLALSTNVLAVVTGPAGGNEPHSNYQPSLGVTYFIKVDGDFQTLGEVRAFAGTPGNTTPKGWLRCDGQLLPINQNTSLFSKLGNSFGGNGQTTFALPDLRDRVAIGAGQGVGLTNRPLGATVGAASSALTIDQLPSHAHVLDDGDADNVTGATGSGQPFSLMQPSLALNHYVNFFGNFPSPGEPGGGNAPFIGQVKTTAAMNIPNTAVLADGAQYTINGNTSAFSLMGDTFGGNGQTTFAVPDLRGRAPMHVGTGAGLTPRSRGQTVGAESHALTLAEMPVHAHGLAEGDSTESAGAGQPYDNMQPSLGLHYIIALQGEFPSSESSPDSSMFLGEISLFAGSFAPRGWAFCDGQLLSISQNTALFALLGTTFGGNGQTTFALPDLRGRIAVDDGSLIARGSSFGSETYALKLSELATHTHSVPEPASASLIAIALGCVVSRRVNRAACKRS